MGWKIASAWDLDPSLIGGCLALLIVHAAACRRDFSRAGWFAAGDLLMLLALISPLDVLSDQYLFSAHMVQHLILVLVVPPLLILGIPPPLALAVVRVRPLRAVEYCLRNPVVAWTLAMLVLWIWHLPRLYDATLKSEALHIFEHLTFLVSSTIFWWPILSPLEESRLGPGAAVAYLAAAAISSGILGILITFAPPALYSAYLNPHDPLAILDTIRHRWGITAEADQQLGGLLMWVAGGMVYLGAIIAVLARWYRAPELDAFAGVSHGA